MRLNNPQFLSPLMLAFRGKLKNSTISNHELLISCYLLCNYDRFEFENKYINNIDLFYFLGL